MSIDAQIREALQNLPVGAPEPLSTLLQAQPDLVMAFRRRVLWRAAVHGLGQRRHEVNRYLAIEFGTYDEHSQSTPRDADQSETTELDGFPTEEVMVVADGVSLLQNHWLALAKERPGHPIQWFANRIVWRTADHLKRKGIVQSSPERPPCPTGHHAVEHRLWVLETLDVCCNPNTPTPNIAGVYEQALNDVTRRIEEAALAQAADAPAYTMKKLFPSNVWSAGNGAELHRHSEWLTHHIVSVEGRSQAWQLAVQLGTGTAPKGNTLSELIDRSARYHRDRETGPRWPEVLAWSGDSDAVAAGGDAFKKHRDRRAKRVTRLDKQVPALVGEAVAAVFRQVGVEEPSWS